VLNQLESSSLGYVMVKLLNPNCFERTIIGSIYLNFLQNYLPIYFENISLDVCQKLWFQQDDAPAHYSQDVRIFLDEQYPSHWIGRG